MQFGIKAAAVSIAIVYSIIGTLVILYILDNTIGMRSKTEEEMQGLYYAYYGERGYGMLNPN